MKIRGIISTVDYLLLARGFETILPTVKHSIRIVPQTGDSFILMGNAIHAQTQLNFRWR